MHPFPHRYLVTADATASGSVQLASTGITAALESTPPPEFDGPAGYWSPESLFVASIADCYVLSFRAVAGPLKLAYDKLQCKATGTLEKTREGICFTEVALDVSITVPAGSDMERAQKLLAKAEQVCLISNSIKAAVHLQTRIDIA